jgi:hypothetical protein
MLCCISYADQQGGAMAKKIDDEIAAIEEKLKQAKAKKQKMEAATRAAEAKALRASLDHRKILLGALLMRRMEMSPDYASKVLKEMDSFLTRDRDRKAFGLEPLAAVSSGTDSAPQKAPEAPATTPPAPAPQQAPEKPPTQQPQQAPAPAPAPAEKPPIIFRNDMLLKTEFIDRDDVKRLGAKWHSEEKKWYVPAGMDARPFSRWMP